MNQASEIGERERTNANAFEQNLGTFGWAAILIVTGAIWLMPKDMLPDGIWLTSMGLILLGLNAARYSVRKQWDSCSLVLGILALGAGVGAILRVNLPLLAITLIVFGLLVLLVPRYGGKPPDSRHPQGRCCEP